MTPYMQQQYVKIAWLGSLLDNKRDVGLNGGLAYRRNRYVDGKTGRFSQPDPIGLAGGLNSYGFAAGDPVNFSDPFGLNPILGVAIAEAIEALAARFIAQRALTAVVTAAAGVARVAGRLGSESHRALGREVADMVATTFRGTLVSGGGGAERAIRVAGRLRFPDVHMALPGGAQLFVNVGKMNANGTPVSREVGALADLAKEGIAVFAPYGLRK